jgi:signal recognition particle subunit SRP54
MFKAALGGIIQNRLKNKLVKNTISLEDINPVLAEIKISLLEADVNFKVVKKITSSVASKLEGRYLSKGETLQNVFISTLKDEIKEILGSKTSEINYDKNNRIMLVGLQGSGKTTTCAKLANYIKNKKQKSVMLSALDIYRPAAIDQLVTLANSVNISIHEKGNQDPLITAEETIAIAKQDNVQNIVFDTAGRLSIDEQMMNELYNLKKIVKPDYTIFVVDAMSGQDIIDVANKFNEKLNLDGFIVTKLDSDARGGAALSLVSIVNKPILFLGDGEKIGGLDNFHPDRIAERILGLGDMVSLAEKAKEVLDEDKAKGQMEKILSGKFDLEDLMNQMESMNKMGSMKSIVSMLPGNMNIDDKRIEEANSKMAI